jgi:hypothetical protein
VRIVSRLATWSGLVGHDSLTALEGFLDRHTPRAMKGTAVDGIHVVMQMLPASDDEPNGEPQYRIKSEAHGQEQIVREHQLKVAVKPTL